ncbi:MAG: TlpA family protein disulfide reductase [Candidatus Acidiferrales bacterium]
MLKIVRTVWCSSNRFAAFVFILLFVSIATGPGARADQSAAHDGASRRLTKKTASLPLIDGAGYQSVLAKYRGKPVMVNFWATWCEPCRYEFPMIVQLAHEYQPKGLVVLGVNLDDDADMRLVRDFLAKNQPPFPSYRQKPGIDVDAFYHDVNPAWTGTMPQTIFYDRDGKIAGYFFGGQSRQTFDTAISGILTSPAGHPPR